MSDRRLTTDLVAAVMAKITASGVIPSLTLGECIDGGTRPTVVLDSGTVARQMSCAGDPPGPGERVWVLQALGRNVVVGRTGGSQRLLGYAVETGTDAFTTQETLGGLTVDVTVNRPGRVIGLFGSAQFTVDTNSAVVIGEFTWDGADNGRYFRHAFPSSSDAEFGHGHALVIDPDPGVYSATMDGTCNGGTGTLRGDTTPAYLTVLDLGPVGGTMT